MIMSRSEEKLQKVADEISETRYCLKHTHTHSHHLSHTLTEAQYDVEVMVIAVDFSSGQEIYPQIAQQLKNLDIGVLSMRVSEIGQREALLHLVSKPSLSPPSLQSTMWE